MSIIQAVLLGALQGVAEFLPISSSGHLTLVQHLFGLEDIPLLFDISLHVATLLAVILVFRRLILDLLCTAFRWMLRKSTEEDKPKLQMILSLIAATAVTGVFGIVLKKIIPDLPIQVVFAGFIVTAMLLFISSKISKKNEGKEVKNISLIQGLITGAAQGIGVLPGISRSGITISAALAAGIDRKTAGEFSFLLSIPAILAAFVLELGDLGNMTQSISIQALLLGCLAAFAVGIFALKFLLALIRKGKLEWFAYYLIPLALICFIFVR
ncbi:MAG TPA: undecaprenyl-diphosphate phosphatase [Treponemataceae bacterium]|jgi:undecaprenyl-diphosphatase|nr:undecaprenyl-diphosphate phosphatase [Treponemataceae bacterium]